MTNNEISTYRLHNQQLTQQTLTTPGEVVSWFGAVQAQDYAAGKWAIGNRLPGLTEVDIEQSIADRTVIRTWPMRGTLHFVGAADIHWILELLHPRSQALYANYWRRNELDETAITKCYGVLTKALEGEKQLKRSELKIRLQEAGIPTDENRLGILLGRASYDRLICHSGRSQNEFTFALLDEWVPKTKSLLRDEALAEFTRRYFTSHGPATVADFSWWSSLTLTEARAGLELIKSGLVLEVVDGQTYWMPSISVPKKAGTTAYLLPVYDEYLVAYKDRSAPFDGLSPEQITATGNGIFSPVIVVDGQIVGTWKRTLKKTAVLIETRLFAPLSDGQHQALTEAKNRYVRFLGMA
ncbi:winged helix DNA-binding domain-containing protein [Larkinella terrae]|uniref:Winged helix DNA-binding domain-containing protein n=1 Tax=Larkinella terrae TaxID=2025311 RepID=A0A7K0EG52_9BACT|nr:winged helix DNA-binding domain-containing protein [Larkinella terrae]MRS60682.1 winged helix DNA-binding domain-containing protein [Larkinella terrae]